MSRNQQNGCDPSPNEVAQENTSKVRDAVKTIQSKELDLPISPLPKPRRFSPVPSPTTPKRKSPVPERVKARGVKVTPPESPMRRRSEILLTQDGKPKPPVRKRKKKFKDDDAKESQAGTNRNSVDGGTDRSSIDSEFVTIEAHEVVGGGGEEGGVEEGQEERGAGGGDTVKGEMKEGTGERREQRARFESFVMVEGEVGKHSARASPDVTLPEEVSGGDDRSDQDLSNQTGSRDGAVSTSPEALSSYSGSSPDLSPSIMATIESSDPQISDPQVAAPDPARVGLVGGASLALSGKKKPPPLPPPPYSASQRPPPIPAKQRTPRTPRRNLGEPTIPEATAGAVSMATDTTSIPTAITTAPTPTDADSTKQLSAATNVRFPKSPTRSFSPQSSLKTNTTERRTLSPMPIYEEVEYLGDSSGSGEPLTPMNSVEVRVLTSRPDTMPKHVGYGSSDSLELSEGSSIPYNRHSTIGMSAMDHRRVKAKTRTLASGRPNLKGTRPLSDASLNLLEGYDVVIAAGHLQDVMMSVISNDEKMQEASIYEVVQACMKAMPHVTSTKELPPHIPTMPSDTRSKVIHELYTTEYTYVKSLETLSEVFKDPLAAVLGEESGRIFANVDDILAFNKGFLALLHARLSSWKPGSCLGDLFIGMFTQSHRSMYAIYCSNYDSAEMLVQQKKKKKEFEQQLATCFQSPRVMPGLTLAAYLITPVQRVPRYILLLKDIIQRTPDKHPDYKNLKTALGVMGELADYIDAQIRESQTKRTFDSLKNKVVGLADLESPDRSLVKEGQCYLKNIKKLYQCILFNDKLVFAHGDSRQSRVQLQLPLEGVWVEDLEDLDPQTSNQDAIEVYTPDRPYTIYTRTSAEKKLWLGKLKETIYQLLLKDKKCLSSSSLGTMERTATFVYADGRLYTGNYVCARRHGKGTMVWPDQSKYIGDWVDDERHGEGQFTFSTREVYEGRWIEDRINGYGKITFASDDKYIGYWKDGVRHGKGKITYSNGDLFEGSFVNGQIEGEGWLRCRNKLEYKGAWKHSQRHGEGRLRTVLGNTYEGEFSRNQISGKGRMVYRNGDMYDGHWKMGMRQGHGKYTSKREGVYDGTWFNDLRHGKGRQQYPNGDVYDGSWELNVRHGKGVLEFSSGEKYNGDFSCDMISGEGEMMYADDCRYNGQWMNGLHHGQGIMVYNESSHVKSTFNGDWRHGLRHGQGELVLFDGSVYRGLWANDKPHGKGNYSVPSANYHYAGDWVEGRREGRGAENSLLGLSYDGLWKNDQKHGAGEEKTLVGTTFTGNWEKNRKQNRGIRKTVTGTVEEQVWRNGALLSDPFRKTAVELPQLPRLDYF